MDKVRACWKNASVPRSASTPAQAQRSSSSAPMRQVITTVQEESRALGITATGRLNPPSSRDR